MWFEGSKNGLQVVDIFRESAVGERFLDTGLIERDLEGEMIVDSKAKPAGRVFFLLCGLNAYWI
jgi:hypothetical protein